MRDFFLTILMTVEFKVYFLKSMNVDCNVRLQEHQQKTATQYNRAKGGLCHGH